MDTTHKPVLLHESLNQLKIKPGSNYVDCTLGGGGHSLEIINQSGHLYGIDVDQEAITRTKERFKKACPGAFYKLAKSNFAKLEEITSHWKLESVSGIIADLGLSSDQIDDGSRGFSFQVDAPLDMRVDLSLGVTAKDLVNGLSKKELIKLLETYGQESWAKKIAQVIVEERKNTSINTTKHLAEVIQRAKPRLGKIHPATQTFQALRIAVNDEINNLKIFLAKAVNLLEPSGRLVVISFHSLEDKIVKNFMNQHEQLNILTKKPIIATSIEVAKNPRARSAKLRAAKKI